MKLTIQDLQKYCNEEKHLYASDSKTGLRLYITFTGKYIITKDHKTVLETNHAVEAIDYYNQN